MLVSESCEGLQPTDKSLRLPWRGYDMTTAEAVETVDDFELVLKTY